MIELTVLGCSGSYGAPGGDACSGYLVRTGGATLWLDCGNGSFANLQRHAQVEEIDAVVITHAHPDHCVDIYSLHVMYRYGLERAGLPVYAAPGVEKQLRVLVDDWGGTFTWECVDDGDAIQVKEAALRFSRTDHPPPTVAVEVAGGGRRLVYTSDTGPLWSPEAFGAGADLVLSEASYLHEDIRAPIHLSAHQAGALARESAAAQLMLTHIWPTIDPIASQRQASESFGRAALLAVAHETTCI